MLQTGFYSTRLRDGTLTQVRVENMSPYWWPRQALCPNLFRTLFPHSEPNKANAMPGNISDRVYHDGVGGDHLDNKHY